MGPIRKEPLTSCLRPESWTVAAKLYVMCYNSKGPSQKYLEANEVKYFSLGGGGRRFHGHYFTFSKKIGFMLVFTIIE